MPARIARSAAIVVLLGLGLPGAAAADFPGAGGLADAIVEGMVPRWRGPRVPAPTPTPRPGGLAPWADPIRPVAVHAPPGWPRDRVEGVLRALGIARARLAAEGWPAPPDDGGRGGTSGFDLYLVPGQAPEARYDVALRPAALDGAVVHAVADPTLGPTLACVTMAYADALLLALDPAEAPAWRRATAAWLAHRVSGHWGCAGAPVVAQQRDPWRSWIGGAAERGAGGALPLALLADRHGDAFVQTLWQGARQLTWEGEGLRARPDLFSALETALERAGTGLAAQVESIAVARAFAGTDDALYPTLRRLPRAARVPLEAHVRYRGKAFALPPAEPPLEPLGSAYQRVELADVPADHTVGVWLRGELGVRWSLAVVRLDADGAPRGRVSAPVRRDPSAFVPVALDAETRALLLVVTNLSSRLPDPTIPEENVRTFSVTVGPVAR